MLNNYTIILFKNKVRYKILKNYKTYKNAENFYNNKIKENESIFFGVETENGRPVHYEIALMEKFSKKQIPLFKTDPLGRNIPIKSDDNELTIIKLDDFKIPEKIFHIDSKTKIDSNLVISKFLRGDNLKMISKLNNKIIIQDEDIFNLFSLKNESDADRFLSELQNNLITKGKKNYLMVRDTDTSQKKYLYNLLEQNGYNKKMLYRKTTTHSKDI
jgi:hypothetical protein